LHSAGVKCAVRGKKQGKMGSGALVLGEVAAACWLAHKSQGPYGPLQLSKAWPTWAYRSKSARNRLRPNSSTASSELAGLDSPARFEQRCAVAHPGG